MADRIVVWCEGEQSERLEQMALRWGLTPSEAGARLIEEGLREAEFHYVDFRDSPAGRQPYVRGSRLAVWEVVMVAQSYAMDATRTAEHFQWPIARVIGALDYAAAFSLEIADAIHQHDSFDFDDLQAMLPAAEVFHLNDDENRPPASMGRTEGV